MAQQPTYILAPNFHFKPGTGPIALGNIIADPLRPHRALTTVDASTLQKSYPRIERFTDYERSITRGNSRDVSMSVWADFLSSVSAKVAGSRGSEVQSTYTMDSLQSMFFVNDPPLEEIRSRLRDPMVQAVTKAGRILGFRTPVYMVTGLMVAKGFSADVGNTQRRSGEVELSGSGPSPIGQLGARAGLARSTSTEKADQWKAGEDIVFAYQLLQIEIKGWKGDRIAYDELRHKSALLGKDDDDDADDDDEGTDDEEKEEGLEIVVSSTRADNYWSWMKCSIPYDFGAWQPGYRSESRWSGQARVRFHVQDAWWQVVPRQRWFFLTDFV